MRQGSHSPAPFISLQSLFAVKTAGLGGHSCEAAVANVVAEPFWVKGVLVTVPFHVRELRTRSNQNMPFSLAAWSGTICKTSQCEAENVYPCPGMITSIRGPAID